LQEHSPAYVTEGNVVFWNESIALYWHMATTMNRVRPGNAVTVRRDIAVMLIWMAILAGCGKDEQQPAASDAKAASSPASVISVLGVRG
jgi:cytosine/uracil/thiamine/allantoin permease